MEKAAREARRRKRERERERGLALLEQLARAGDLHSQVAALHAQMRKLMGEPPMAPADD